MEIIAEQEFDQDYKETKFTDAYLKEAELASQQDRPIGNIQVTLTGEEYKEPKRKTTHTPR